MTTPLVLQCHVQVERRRHGQRILAAKASAPVPKSPGRVPRVARLLALAIKLDGLVRQGVLSDYASIARLGHVSRARVTQIMTLLNLAPDIQEAVLFLPMTKSGRDVVQMRHLVSIGHILDWAKQRHLWRRLRATALEKLGQ